MLSHMTDITDVENSHTFRCRESRFFECDVADADFFFDCFYQLRQYVTPQDDMLGSQNGYSQKWRVTNAMGEDSNATYDKPMEPACVTYPSISEQPDVRMLKPRGRETESIWTSGETIKGTLGKPRHPLFNFVFGVESFQSLEVCGCGAAHRSRKYVRLLAASRRYLVQRNQTDRIS